MNIIIIGNIVSFTGALFMVATGFIKERKKILVTQNFQYAIMGLGNLILGGVSGFISNLLGIIRNLFCLKHELPLWAGIAFVALQAVLTLTTNNVGFIGMMPVIAALIFTLFINSKNEAVLKGSIIAAELCWIAYDIYFNNYASLCFDAFTIASNIIGILMLRHGKKTVQKQ